ncbi:hypothetical protein OQ257_12045, partial [Actinobacillus equuli subsp. equuli]
TFKSCESVIKLTFMLHGSLPSLTFPPAYTLLDSGFLPSCCWRLVCYRTLANQLTIGQAMRFYSNCLKFKTG